MTYFFSFLPTDPSVSLDVTVEQGINLAWSDPLNHLHHFTRIMSTLEDLYTLYK